MLNNKPTIGITIVATNLYFVLGVRLMKKLTKHYKGDCNLKFFFCSNVNPIEVIPESINFEFIYNYHPLAVESTFSKFDNILSIEDSNIDHIFYIDSDTNISQDFGDSDLGIGANNHIVVAEHPGSGSMNRSAGLTFEDNPNGMAFFETENGKYYDYYQGAFFGGPFDKVITMCEQLEEWRHTDTTNNIVSLWHDESYLNKYTHCNVVVDMIHIGDFKFDISDKGGVYVPYRFANDVPVSNISQSEYVKLKLNKVNLNMDVVDVIAIFE